jgi:hypothetical protein
VTASGLVRSAGMTTRLVVISICAAGAVASSASASCIPSTEREDIKRADAVFTGRVLSVPSSNGRATFRVLRVRKGRGRIHKGDTVRVYPEFYPSSITINWKPRGGERWRVYTQRRKHRWITNDCLGTRRL